MVKDTEISLCGLEASHRAARPDIYLDYIIILYACDNGIFV